MAERFAALGMKVVLADLDGPALGEAAGAVAAKAAGGPDHVLAVPTDVAERSSLAALEKAARAAFGDVAVLLNNAGVESVGSALGMADGDDVAWQRIMAVNLWGVVHGVQAFAPGMLESGRPGAIVNTGSKQGITNPPGNAAYNTAKAGVKAFTEQVAHELRNAGEGKVTGHLLVPGFTYTGFTRQRGVTEKPAGAWTPEQVADLPGRRPCRRRLLHLVRRQRGQPRHRREAHPLGGPGHHRENRPAAESRCASGLEGAVRGLDEGLTPAVPRCLLPDARAGGEGAAAGGRRGDRAGCGSRPMPLSLAPP